MPSALNIFSNYFTFPLLYEPGLTMTLKRSLQYEMSGGAYCPEKSSGLERTNYNISYNCTMQKRIGRWTGWGRKSAEEVEEKYDFFKADVPQRFWANKRSLSCCNFLEL